MYDPKEDLDVFLDSEFAVPAEWTDSAGATKDLRVIFDKGPVEGPTGYQNRIIKAHCKTEDVEDMAQGDIVLINDITYYVLDPPEPDATGMTELILSLDTP